jgi:hypothetical protein
LDIDAWTDALSMCRQLYTWRVWSLNLSDSWECSFIEALLQGLWRACWKSVIMQCV